MAQEVRIDKWMWAVRLFKTRSKAADACKKNKVTVDGIAAKPSRMVKVGEVIGIRKGPVTCSFEILAIAHNRMGAKLVPDFCKNVTSKDQLELMEMQRLAASSRRQKGLGRPTKKERRDLEAYAEELFFIDEEWNFDEEDDDQDEK
ncbi:MAG: RNA-binding S4 domain-containing protein [Paludibacteraceae bacterium]|jgi:ribosome-associated heat shock protein Hsp15|nr:RNA-binding S4 domain-containing protein [Paludibacteraceae bacterium]